MERANGTAKWTLGCAEHLTMQRLLLCNLEDKPDGHVDITVRGPVTVNFSCEQVQDL
jgi:hypothetical protein